MELVPYAVKVALLSLYLFSSATEAQQRISTPEVPVMIGPTAGSYRVCDVADAIILGEVEDGEVLAAYSGPGDKDFGPLDPLRFGMHVRVCDAHGDWMGIVYAPTGGSDGCNLVHLWREPLPYLGPCRSGWVLSRFVERP